jgi:hypothetical protein
VGTRAVLDTVVKRKIPSPRRESNPYYFFLFATASRPALGPTHSPFKLVQGAVTLGLNQPGRVADHSPPSSAEVKNA